MSNETKTPSTPNQEAPAGDLQVTPIATPEEPKAPDVSPQEAQEDATRLPEGMILSDAAHEFRQANAALSSAVSHKLTKAGFPGYHNALRWLQESDANLRKVHNQLLEGEAQEKAHIATMAAKVPAEGMKGEV